VVICLERGADLHTAQPMPLSLTVSCFGKIQIGFIFLVQAHLGSPGQRVVKRVCVTVLNGDRERVPNRWCCCAERAFALVCQDGQFVGDALLHW